jgi:hypothetical protein
MSDLIDRQAALEALRTCYDTDRIDMDNGDEYIDYNDAVGEIEELPSARSSLITWLLDEIWDEEMWELNWQAFPELLCRKLEKLGYVKRTGDEYERLD